MAYLEFCGIKLDETKWKAKMKKDQTALNESQEKLNTWLRNKAAKDFRFKKIYSATIKFIWF